MIEDTTCRNLNSTFNAHLQIWSKDSIWMFFSSSFGIFGFLTFVRLAPSIMFLLGFWSSSDQHPLTFLFDFLNVVTSDTFSVWVVWCWSGWTQFVLFELSVVSSDSFWLVWCHFGLSLFCASQSDVVISDSVFLFELSDICQFGLRLFCLSCLSVRTQFVLFELSDIFQFGLIFLFYGSHPSWDFNGASPTGRIGYWVSCTSLRMWCTQF